MIRISIGIKLNNSAKEVIKVKESGRNSALDGGAVGAVTKATPAAKTASLEQDKLADNLDQSVDMPD